MAIKPTQQTILAMEFADSESDSDDEIVETNPPNINQVNSILTRQPGSLSSLQSS